MPRDLPNWDDPGFCTWPGCVTILGIFLSFLGVAAGVTAQVRRGAADRGDPGH